MARHYATRAEARPSAARLKAARRRVLAWLLRRGRLGGTDHEIAEACELMLDTARARRVELRDAGLVRDSGRRRPSPTGKPATVWEAALETAEAEAPAAARRPGGAREPLPIGNTSAEPARRVLRVARPRCPACDSPRLLTYRTSRLGRPAGRGRRGKSGASAQRGEPKNRQHELTSCPLLRYARCGACGAKLLIVVE